MGGFSCTAGTGGDGCRLPRSVQRLVAHLALGPGPTRDAVAGALWPDVLDQQAQASLRTALWRLARTAPGLVDASPTSVALARGVDVDTHRLRSWAQRCMRQDSPLVDIALPSELLGGELLPGWDDEWVLLERERIRQLRAHALEALAGGLLRAGRHGEALDVGYAAVRCEPFRESAHRLLVRVHLAEGNLVEAHRVHRRFSTLLRDELGLTPTPMMAQLLAVGPARRAS